MSQILGATAWGAVIERLRAESDLVRGQQLATRLREIGPDAARLFANALARETDGQVALRLLALASSVQDEAGLWTALQALLRHADAKVRESTLALIMARNDEPAAKALATALREEGDAERRKSWIQALARLNNPAAHAALAEELNNANAATPPDEASLLPLLEVLSAAGHRSVIPTAVKLLQPGQSGAPPSATPRHVVLAAVKALAPFYRDMEVAEELERLRKDKDPEIARLALVCLRGIVAAQQQQVSQAAAQEMPPSPPLATAETVAPAAPKPHRGFEVLEASAHMESQFTAGAAIGSSEKPGSRVREAIAAVPPPAKPGAGEPPLEGLKPSLEGMLDDLGLVATLRMVGSREGVLTVSGAAGKGRAYIKGRKIVRAHYGNAGGLAALAAIRAAKGLSFAYFPMAISVAGELDVDVSKVQEALRGQH
jgi:hypothetical protein